MATIGEDLSVASPASMLQIGLNDYAKKVGVNYVINLDSWKQPQSNIDKSSITIVPIISKSIRPLNNASGNILEATETTIVCAFWAVSYDALEQLRSFFRQYSLRVFKRWVVFGDFEYDVAEQDQKGRLGFWTITVKTQLMKFRNTEGETLILTTYGTAESPPLEL